MISSITRKEAKNKLKNYFKNQGHKAEEVKVFEKFNGFAYNEKEFILFKLRFNSQGNEIKKLRNWLKLCKVKPPKNTKILVCVYFQLEDKFIFFNVKDNSKEYVYN